MPSSARRSILGGVAAATGALVLAATPTSAQAADPDLVLLQGSQLVRVAPDAPATAKSTVSITGLDGGDVLVGIDVRPATGVLHGLGRSGRLYTINPATGAATPGPMLATALAGSDFSVDVNPAADRLRVISDTGQSLRINLADGATTVDTSLTYAPADPGAGTTPRVVAIAYTNPDADAATGTELFDVDAARDVLVLQNPPNDGVLTTRGPIGTDVDDAAMDIGPSGRALAAVAGRLVRVDLANGTTTDLGDLPGTAAVDDLAFLLPTPPATTTTTAAPTTTTAASSPTTAPAELPRTGDEHGVLTALGALLLASGTGFLALERRRRTTLG